MTKAPTIMIRGKSYVPFPYRFGEGHYLIALNNFRNKMSVPYFLIPSSPFLSQLMEAISDCSPSFVAFSRSLAISRLIWVRLSSSLSASKESNVFISVVKKGFGHGIEYFPIDDFLPSQVYDQGQ